MAMAAEAILQSDLQAQYYIQSIQLASKQVLQTMGGLIQRQT